MGMDPEPLDYERSHPALRRGGWVQLRFNGEYPEPRFPLICVSCLTQTTGRELLITSRSRGFELRNRLVVGLCAECRRLWRKRQSLVALPLVFLATLLSLFSIRMGGGSWGSAVTGAAGAAGMSVFLAFLLIATRLSPVQINLTCFIGLPLCVRFRNRAFMSIYLSQGEPAERNTDDRSS